MAGYHDNEHRRKVRHHHDGDGKNSPRADKTNQHVATNSNDPNLRPTTTAAAMMVEASHNFHLKNMMLHPTPRTACANAKPNSGTTSTTPNPLHHVGDNMKESILNGLNLAAEVTKSKFYIPNSSREEDRPPLGVAKLEQNKKSNLRRNSSRLNVSPAQIAAAVDWIHRQQQEGGGHVGHGGGHDIGAGKVVEGVSDSLTSIYSTRRSFSLASIEQFARSNSSLLVTNNSWKQQQQQTLDHEITREQLEEFDSLRELMGDDAVLIEANDDDGEEVAENDRGRGVEKEIEDEGDSNDPNKAIIIVDGEDNKRNNKRCEQTEVVARKNQYTHHFNIIGGGEGGEDGRGKGGKTMITKKTMDVISLSPMCRLSNALHELFGDDIIATSGLPN